jgi:hypothetical protein
MLQSKIIVTIFAMTCAAFAVFGYDYVEHRHGMAVLEEYRQRMELKN